jgi:hypothetical protein
MQSIQTILSGINPLDNKYISRDFQLYGCELAEKLEDWDRKSLYIKLAKTTPRSILEQAYAFVSDSNAKNKGALFMWKLKQMGALKKKKAPPKKKSVKKKKKDHRPVNDTNDLALL